MVIISPAIDDADPVAAANNFDPLADALPLSNVVHGATADVVVGAGTTPWWGWSGPPPYYVGSDAHYASSSFPPPPLDDLACYAGSIMDTSLSFPQLPPAPPVYMQPELSYLYYLQPKFAPVLEPAGIPMRPEELQVPTTSMPPPSYYPQTQAATAGSASVEEASPALVDTRQAQEVDTRPTPRRRGRPSKRALAVSEPPVSEPTKRIAVGTNRAASSSQKTSSAATGGLATIIQVPDQAGGSRSSTGSTSSGQQTAACSSQISATALLCEEQCQHPDFSNAAPAGLVVEGHHQQAATAPPEAMVTGPQYADTSAVGVRFQPKDEQLIEYLRMKYAEQQMPVNFFKEFDVYQAHPTAIKGACGESQNGCWYAFSRRDRRYLNGKRPARSVFVEEEEEEGSGKRKQKQVGFWKSNSRLGEVRAGGKKDGAVIGRMTSLTFQLGRQPKGKQTGWKMREYTIPENQHQPDGSALLLNDWVVCQLFYKERPGCTEEENEADTSVGQERPPYMHGKSEKSKNVVSVGQKRPRRSRKSSKTGKNAILVESVQGEEDMQQPQMVPAAHQASDYSEQDLCVEDYLVCDVAFAQQNDAAKYTI